MLEEIQTALDAITQQYQDTRLHLCQIEVAALEDGRCLLSGVVLDAETRMEVTTALTARFPAITFDTGDVQALRPGDSLTVATNLTSLHAEPSFRSEMLSQLLNGARLEMLREQDRWVFVRQPDGYLGWMYRPYLTPMAAPDPTHVVCEPVSLMQEEPDLDAPLISRVVAGTTVSAAALETSWACVSLAAGMEGWVPIAHLRALDTFPRDKGTQRRCMIQDAARFTGVPYLWGGSSALSIDCSGMVQLLHRLVGLTIPRDADMQYAGGQPVKPPFQPGDLLFFGSEGGRRSITHVGMSLGGWRIVHASRARNGVYEDDVQAVAHLRESFVGACTFVGEEAGDVR